MILNPIATSDEHGKMDIFSLNLENGIVLLTGEINDEMAASVVSQLLYLDYKGTDIIRLYINSPGGSVSAGLSILDTIEALHTPVSTVCMGIAASMAAVIFSAGAKGDRVMLPHSEVMIHQPWGGTSGQAADIMIAAAHIGRLKEELNVLLAENCNRSVGEIEEMTDRDRWMDSDEAIRFGIADRIVTGKEI